MNKLIILLTFLLFSFVVFSQQTKTKSNPNHKELKTKKVRCDSSDIYHNLIGKWVSIDHKTEWQFTSEKSKYWGCTMFENKSESEWKIEGVNNSGDTACLIKLTVGNQIAAYVYSFTIGNKYLISNNTEQKMMFVKKE